jgi:uncharacterized SAM-binding protein YcdF (DUF218 family)
MIVAGMLEVLKMIGGPGSIGFLAFCAVIGLAATRLGPRWRPIARGWLLLLFSAYLVLGFPWIAVTIADGLPGMRDVPADSLLNLDALIVLGGDNSVGRAQTSARVYASSSPRLVIVSGEQWLVDRIEELGIPPDRLVVDSRSTNTREQIAEVQRQWHARHWNDNDRVALIASRLQMPRVARLVQQSGLKVMLVSSPVDREPATSGPWTVVPAYAALRVSRDALYEHAALAYYRRRGWIAAD